jgi:hypothetical protein
LTTSWECAGVYLKIKANPEEHKKATEAERIDSKLRPVILNFKYVDRSWNWNWIGSILNTFVSAPPTPPSAAKPTSKEDQKKTEEEERKKQEEAQARQAKLVGGVITGIAVFLSGLLYDEYQRYQETFSYTQEVSGVVNGKEGIFGRTGLSVEENFVIEIRQLVASQVRVDMLNMKRVSGYFYTALSGVIGGAIMTWGGFTATLRLITTGQVMVFITAIFGLYHLGRHWNDTAKIRKEYEKQMCIAPKVDECLSFLDDRMNGAARSSAASSYTPLYPIPSAPLEGE